MSVVGCKHVLIVDPAHTMYFSIVNALAEEVTIHCDVAGVQHQEYLITLAPDESYSYWHEVMGNMVEPGKIPVNSSDSISISVNDRPILEYLRAEHAPLWKENSDHVFELTINDSLWGQ